MRNLKRALSLLLSSTMVLGMLVMGGSAAGYQDVDDSNKNQEAIEVLQAVGIMTGDQNGNFNPDGSITRNEMAVVMAHLLNLDYDYYRGTNPFTDVPEWAAPYVAACAAEGVVTGIGNGQYGGDQKVTAAQAALMIMKALGYFQNAEDFGTDWQVATIRQASYINLFNKIDSNAESALTRGQVAQLVLNGLTSDMVYFTGDKGIQIGDVTVGYRAEYTQKTGTAAKYNTLVNGKTDISEQGQYYVQLGEELYEGKLTATPDTDDFERPATTWVYDKKEIGTYVNWELLVEEYTTGITGEDLYDLLGKSVIADNYVDYYVDGYADSTIKASNMIRTNTETYTSTGNGVLTQVFFDKDEEQITIVSVNTYLAQVSSDYNEKKETLSVSIWAPTAKKDTVIALDDVAGIEGYKKGDMIMVNVAYNGSANTVKYDVVNVMEPKVMSDVKLTKYSENKYVVADGTQYDYALTGSNTNQTVSLNEIKTYGSNALTNYSYNLYLDQYGYLIGNEVYEGEDNYVFITGYDFTGSHLANATATANAIFLDGTMKNITVHVNDTQANIASYNAKGPDGIASTGDEPTNAYTAFNLSGDSDPLKSEYNRWFTYVVDDDVYTLTPADNWMNVKYTDPAHASMKPYSVRLVANATNGISVIGDNTLNVASTSSRSYGNDDSVYVTVDAKSVSAGTMHGITKVLGTYTGVDETDIDIKTTSTNGLSAGKSSVYAVYDEDLYIIGAVVIGEDSTSSEHYGYALKNIGNEYIDGDNNHYWDIQAVVDGEIVTLTVKTSVGSFTTVKSNINAAIGAGNMGLMKFTYDADGYVTNAVVVNDTNTSNKLYDNYLSDEFGTDVDPDLYSLYAVGWGSVGSDPAANFTVSGRTLYASATDAGLRLATNAPVVVVQPRQDENGNALSDSIETFADFETAIESLSNKASFNGWISAVINEVGQASYVVISSCDPITVDIDTGDSRPEDSTITKVDLTIAGKATLTGENATATYNWAVKRNAPGQDTYVTIATGSGKGVDIEGHGWNAFFTTSGASYILVVDGVESNPVYNP